MSNNTEWQYTKEKELLKQNALPIGTILSSKSKAYRVIEVLGAGGFGITYKVLGKTKIGNIELEMEFAIKEYFMKGCDRGNGGTQVSYASTLKNDIEQGLKDFITEANRLNKLSGLSPNIVKVNEVFEANGTAYYVMEYLNGGNLVKYVNKNGALSEEQALSIITPISEAVQMLHDERLLHLDIKPDNIVFKKDAVTNLLIPVLIDFGLAKHFNKKGKPTSQLMAKGATDGYAPQEQYAGIDKFAPEIDVYALGATLYYMLTGKNPPRAFDISSPSIIANALPKISEPIKEAISSAMQQSKFERTSSVRLFLSTIRYDNNITMRIDIDDNTSLFDKIAVVYKKYIKPHILLILIVFAIAILTYSGMRWWISHQTSLPASSIVNDSISIAQNEDTAKLMIDTQQDYPNKAEKPQVMKQAESKQGQLSSKQEKKEEPVIQKSETDAEKFQKAQKANDWNTIKQLADKGYVEAYLPLAEHYLGSASTHNLAEKYANKAEAAGKSGASKIKEVLRAAGYYD